MWLPSAHRLANRIAGALAHCRNIYVDWNRWPGIRVMAPYHPIFMSKECDALPNCKGFLSSTPAWLLSVRGALVPGLPHARSWPLVCG